MSQAVVIKSNKYGIHLVLSNEISFKALLDAIVEKFKESEKFFKGAKLAISFEGRKLTHDEEMAIIDAVTSNTSIEILCIVDHDPDREAYSQTADRRISGICTAAVCGWWDSVLSRNASLWPDT